MSTQQRSQTDIWSDRQGTLLGDDINPAGLIGYSVEALDGSIGKVDDATFDEGSSLLVIDTGRLDLRKKVMLPAGVVQRVDRNTTSASTSTAAKKQIKNAPEYEDHHRDNDAYLSGLGAYYGPGGLGYQDWDDPR